MYYIKSKVSENGNHGTPHSHVENGDYVLPDELLSDYLDTMGFARLTVSDGVVTDVLIDREAYDAYKSEHPEPAQPTPAQQRKEAYNTLRIIPWDDDEITVTEAATLFGYYIAEGNDDVCDRIQTLIRCAKEDIRERYPDE